MTSKQLTEWFICALIGLAVRQMITVDSAGSYSVPCPSVFGYAYRCVKPRNCHNPHIIYQCGPNGIGICCPVISILSLSNCGVLFQPLKRFTGALSLTSSRQMEGFDEPQNHTYLSSTTKYSNNNEESTTEYSNNNEESTTEYSNNNEKSTTEYSDNNEESTTEYSDNNEESTMYSLRLTESYLTRTSNANVLLFTHSGNETFETTLYDDADSTQTLDGRGTISESDQTESIYDDSKSSGGKRIESIMETISLGSNVETTNSGSDAENHDIGDITSVPESDSGFTQVIDNTHKTYSDNVTHRMRRQAETNSSNDPKTTLKLSGITASKDSEDSQETNTTGKAQNRNSHRKSRRRNYTRKGRRRNPPRKSNPQHIIGGRREEFPWPWIVAIYLMPEKRFVCAGTLIDKQHVLSAAHCFQKNFLRIPSNLIVVIGHLYRLDKSNKTENVQYHQVASLTVHSEFNFTCFCSDIAVLRLLNLLGTNYTPACINDVEPSGVGENVTALGWGDMEFITKGSNATRGSYFLQRVDGLIILPGDECSIIFSKVLKTPMPSGFEDYYICAGVPDGTKDACIGDSGGPLMFEDYDGYWTVVGVVSFGYKCATPGIPGTYTKISYFMPWISEVLQSRR
ncbi:hypothetical protein JTE90_024568 [Oedothorax gibbosus]|uniref:Peptidase S1 domain-containing protein n=1 Tax=Oedothorax gibbosus TaxID=931172 RepID=A0AAV6VDZ6_9ARAC|nr:hypothetical protein JTE90_024568 [Oedothorax gibbosus]